MGRKGLLCLSRWAQFIRESYLSLDVSGIALLLDQIHRPHYDWRFDPIRRADFLIGHYREIKSALDSFQPVA
jgi:hypothetical protein